MKREAEEARLELQQREQQQQNGDKKSSLQTDLAGVHQVLGELGSSSADARYPAEVALFEKLKAGRQTEFSSESNAARTDVPMEVAGDGSSISSLASISDRITLLESSLGISHSSPLPSGPLLPTLTALSSQINALTTALSPPNKAGPHSSQTANLNLDDITNRLRDLTKQADRLTTSRKAALQAATDLRQSQLKAAMSSRPMHTDPAGPGHSRNSSQRGSQSAFPLKPHQSPQVNDLTTTELLGYEDQSTKVAALYSLLPRIQELSPLLPLVVERLRSLQVIHTGAAQARKDLDRIEEGQIEMGKEIEEWSAGLQKVESLVGDAEEKMKGNLEVVGDMVNGIEKRIGKLASSN